MEHTSAWLSYKNKSEDLEHLAEEYRLFISDNKTERECAKTAIKLAEEAGYRPLESFVVQNKGLAPGDKIWAHAQGKALMLVHMGEAPLEEGLNILGAHIDSPRLDIKQNPLFEAGEMAYLDTHYYGGIKKYQWVTTPLALHGVIAKTDGSIVEVCLGERDSDPVFCVTDLLIHLARQQMTKQANEVIEGEALDLLVGNKPFYVSKESLANTAHEGNKEDPCEPEGKELVKGALVELMREHYGIAEEDFLSAELEVVPAGPARDLGFDRSMIIGYGQDDRVCAYTSLRAQFDFAEGIPHKTAVCLLVDKEEIGSVGASGMASQFFENTVAEIIELARVEGSTEARVSADLLLRRCLAASKMLSSDVSAGFDPAYASVFETKNTAYCGRGLVLNKYTGAGGKSGSNDARAEFVALLRRIFDEAGVHYQTAELGRVDAGGGGTIAYIPAAYGMDVIDSGVAVLSMHSPWEVSSKVDIYEAYQGYKAFLAHA